jgi:hypothetical protein
MYENGSMIVDIVRHKGNLGYCSFSIHSLPIDKISTCNVIDLFCFTCALLSFFVVIVCYASLFTPNDETSEKRIFVINFYNLLLNFGIF